MSEPQKSSKCLRGVLWLGLHRLDCGVATEGREAGVESGPSIPTFRFDDQRYSGWPRNLLDHALRQALPSGTLTLGLPVAANGAEVTLTGATEDDQKVSDQCPTPYSRPKIIRNLLT